ncbi:MAG TPA: inosine/xanthosine triphosphatase [bacterium]|nr:inosine/xanthosine triphosphatase [bacterium]HPQ65908.1 inosine/xanthosine triphosphatase [bacterium]
MTPAPGYGAGRGREFVPSRVAVGSRNPLKIAAVEAVLAAFRPGLLVRGVAVSSGVAATPLSNPETIAGARQRARLAREATGDDWGIGLEGGMAVYDGRWFSGVWCVIRDGRIETRGGGVHFELPPEAARRIVEEGVEMGTAMDGLAGIEMSKRKMGAEGILTRGLIDRSATFRTAVRYALAPFLHPDWYRPE